MPRASKKEYPFRNRIIKDYPFPSVKNPIKIEGLAVHQARQTLQELSQRIEKGELVYYKKPVKIPALPSLFMNKVSYDL